MALLGFSARASLILAVLFLHRGVALAQSGSLALSDATAELLAVNPDSHSVSVFDVHNGIRKRAEVPIPGIPQAISIDSVSRTAFVTSRQSNTLEVIALESDSLAGCVAVGARHCGRCCRRCGGRRWQDSEVSWHPLPHGGQRLLECPSKQQRAPKC